MSPYDESLPVTNIDALLREIWRANENPTKDAYWRLLVISAYQSGH